MSSLGRAALSATARTLVPRHRAAASATTAVSRSFSSSSNNNDDNENSNKPSPVPVPAAPAKNIPEPDALLFAALRRAGLSAATLRSIGDLALSGKSKITQTSPTNSGAAAAAPGAVSLPPVLQNLIAALAADPQLPLRAPRDIDAALADPAVRATLTEGELETIRRVLTLAPTVTDPSAAPRAPLGSFGNNNSFNATASVSASAGGALEALPTLPVPLDARLQRATRAIDQELFASVMTTDLPRARRLLAAKADPNAWDPVLLTPLTVALRTPNNRALLALLADAGALVGHLLPATNFTEARDAAAAAAAVSDVKGRNPGVLNGAEIGQMGAIPNGNSIVAHLTSDSSLNTGNTASTASGTNGSTGSKWRGLAAPVQLAPIHIAATLGDADNLAFLLERGAPVSSRTSLGDTALHLAAAAAKPAAVELLLRQGAEPNARSPQGTTALHEALRAAPSPQSRMAVDQLLFARANPEAMAADTLDSPLTLAARVGDPVTIKFLLAYGADPSAMAASGAVPVAAAIEAGNGPAGRALAAAGARVGLGSDRRYGNPSSGHGHGGVSGVEAAASAAGGSMLHLAARKNKAGAVAWLVQAITAEETAPANPRFPQASQNSHNNHNDLGGNDGSSASASVRASANAGAAKEGARRPSVDQPDSAGATPLLAAARVGALEALSALLSVGASPDLACHQGHTPLLAAALRGDARMTTTLLQWRAAADLPCAGLLGVTPLMMAARVGSAECVAALLQAGASAARADVKGRDALGWARDGAEAAGAEIAVAGSSSSSSNSSSSSGGSGSGSSKTSNGTVVTSSGKGKGANGWDEIVALLVAAEAK